jgi:L-ascorbate metabolism protein UlaG (beta-lactamase superfamily)
MEIEYRGANCVVIKSKKGVMVVDPTDGVSVSEVKNKDAIILSTHDVDLPSDVKFAINMPGEYEINDVTIMGIPMKRHTDPDGKNATAYRIELDGLRIAVVGHIEAPLSDDVLETFGVIDIAIVPVGGNGYTLDARDAASVVRQLSPKVVIPTHYADKMIKYEVPQEPVELFIKEMGGVHEKISSLKFKGNSLPETLTVYEISKTR